MQGRWVDEYPTSEMNLLQGECKLSPRASILCCCILRRGWSFSSIWTREETWRDVETKVN